jgi:hypothetical protein
MEKGGGGKLQPRQHEDIHGLSLPPLSGGGLLPAPNAVI